MIFYSGWGLLVPLIGAGGFALALFINDGLGGSMEAGLMGFLVGGVFAAGLSWALGSRINHPSRGEIVVDRKTGEHRERRPNHSFMFIPVQYYAFIFAALFGVCLIGVVNHGTTGSPPRRHSEKGAGFSLASLIASLTGTPADAADSRATLDWHYAETRSALNGEVTPSASAEVHFDNDIVVQAAASCDTASVDIEFATFRGSEALPFADRGNTIALRTRFDDRTDRTASAVSQYTNTATILFYDPDGARKALGGGNSGGVSGHGAGLAQALMGFLGMAQIQGSAAGTIADLLSASSIRVELPLSDRSANVVELNPQDASLRQLVRKCIPVAQPDTSGNAAPSPPFTDQSAAFQEGHSDRVTWEKWIGGLSDGYRDGVLFWAEHRSDRSPPSCSANQGVGTNDFSRGCLKAKDILTPVDARRNSEPDYRRGWNSY